jgi:hypothetical protein
MEFLVNFWRNIESLQSLSGYLQWISISLVFIGGALQVAKYAVDRREKQLVSIVQIEKEKAQTERESHLSGKVESLESDLTKRQIEIAELNKKTEFVDPFKQPLRTGTATVEILISSSANVSSHYIDQGGYIAFGKGQDAMLVMNSIDCFGNQIGNNQVLYRGVFNLDATDKSIGKSISHLAEAEYAQIGFGPLPQKSKVIRGSAICTFNSTVRIELSVPAQQMPKDFIIVPEVKKAFHEYIKSEKK